MIADVHLEPDKHSSGRGHEADQRFGLVTALLVEDLNTRRGLGVGGDTLDAASKVHVSIKLEVKDLLEQVTLSEENVGEMSE
jgi:hypothetical protein